MFSRTGDDDAEDFGVTAGGGRSNLASLFGMDQAASKSGNNALVYTAPKQPRKQQGHQGNEQSRDNQDDPGGKALAVLYAVATNVFKYIDGQFAKQGRLGAAILGATGEFHKLLLYMGKQQTVTQAVIGRTFAFTVQANNYANFYDDQRQSWSLMFDSTQNAIAFAKQVAFAKANSGKEQGLVMQDLIPGEGGGLEVDDSAEVRYTGWLMVNHVQGPQFDSNVSADKNFRLKMGRGKVIKGWEEGMIGMKKGGRRLLIIPPSLGYGTHGMGTRVPPNSTLILDVELIKVKLTREHGSRAESPTKVGGLQAEQVDTTDTTVTKSRADSVKDRSASLSEQMSHPSASTDKAQLIQRMAKMGQPMLPMQGAVAAATESDDEDSDSDVVVADASPIHNSPAHRPTISPKPHNLPISKASAADPVKHSATPPPVMQPTMSRPVPQYSRPSAPTAEAVGTIMYGHQAPASLPPHQSMSVYQPAAMPMATLQGFPYYAQPPPASSPAASSDTSLQTFMMESRQQSTEVRLSLSKLQDRVDQITAKIEKLPTSSPQGGQVALPAFGSAMPSMDTAILMNSVQKIVQENEKHKAEIVEKNAKLEKQNEKIAELLDKNQRFMENSNTWMEQRHDIFKSSSEQSQVQLITLQQEKIMMGGELAVAESKVTALQSQLSAEQEKAVALTGQLAAYCADAVKQREEATHLKAMMSEKEQKLASLSQLLCEEEVRKKEAEHKVKQLDSELDILREKTRSLEETHNEMEGKFSLVTQNAETDIWALKAEHEEEARKLSEALTEERRVSEESMNKRLVNTTATVVEEWKVKLASCMETANQQHSDEIEKAEETKTQLMSELEEVRLQMDAERQRQVAHSTELQEEIEVMQVWKDKYIALREQAVAMKLAYTGKIEELTAKLEEQESSNQAPSTDVALEVKRVMSAVYHAARSEFEEQESYSGAEVQSALLRTIKEVTLQLLSPAVRERSESEAMSEGEQESQPQIRQESPLTEHRQQSVAENVTRESAAEEAPESESTARDADASDESFEFVQKTNDSSDRQPEPAELPVVSVHEDDLEPQGQASSMLGSNENPEDAEQMGGAPAKEPVDQLGEYEQQTQLEPQQMGVECEEQVEPSEMLAEQEQSVQAEGGAEEHTKAKIPVESGESNEGVCHEDHHWGQPESAAVDMCVSVGELEQEDEEEQWQQEQPEEDSLSARIREQEQQQEQPENEVLPQQIVPDREAAERVGYAEGGEHIIDETSETESLEAEPLDDLHQQLTVDFREPPNTSFPEGNEYLSNESKNSSAVGQEEVPALVRENEPALVQEEIQALVQEEVSSLVQEEVPSLEQEEIPALVNEKVPALVQEEVPSLEQVEVPSLEQEREPALVQEEVPSLVKEEEPSSVQEEIPALVQEEEPAVVQEEDQPLEQGASTLMQEEQEVASLQQEEEVALMEEKVSEDPKSVAGLSRSSEKASTSLFNDDDDDEEGCRVGKPPAQLVSCPPSRSKVKLSAKKTPPEGTKTSTSLFEEDDAEDEQFGVSLFSQPSVPAQPSSLPGQQASHTPKDSASRRLVDEAMDSDTSSNDSSGANAGRPVPPPLFGDDDDDDNDNDWFK